MKWKCGICALAVSLLAAGVSYAMVLMPMGNKTLWTSEGMKEPVYVDFHEGDQMVEFAAGRSREGKSVLVMFNDKGRLWSLVDDYLAGTGVAQGYSVYCYKDKVADRYFYVVNCIFDKYGNGYHSYVLGFDKDRTKVNQYIDSANFPDALTDNVGIGLKGGQLYLSTSLYYGSRTHRLDWSDEAQWFGYTSSEPATYYPASVYERRPHPTIAEKPADGETRVLYYTIPAQGAGIHLWANRVLMHVGEKLYIRPTSDSVDSKGIHWAGKDGDAIFKLVNAERQGTLTPNGSTELLLTAVKPGTEFLRMTAHDGYALTSASLLIHVIE